MASGRAVLSVVAARDGAGIRGRWLRLAWSQSLAGQPVRLLVRLIREGETEEHPLAAAALGRGAWTWLVPRDLMRFELLAPAGSTDAIRLDALETVSTVRLAAMLLRRRPAALLPLLWWRGRHRSRSVRIHEALDLAEPTDLSRFSAERKRPLEPDGLDASLPPAAAAGPRLGFVIHLEDRAQLPDLRRTLAAFAAQIDRGFSVRVDAEGDLACEIGDGGLGAPQDDVGEENGREATLVAYLLPGDEPCPEAVLLLRAHLAARTELDVLYGDGALRTDDGLEAQLKPDWSPLFQAGSGYIDRPCMVRASLAEDGVPWRDLPGRIAAVRGGGAVGHLKRILFTLAPSTPHVLSDRSAGARDDGAGLPPPRATLVVPTRDGAALLGRLVTSLERLPPGGHDLVVVDNGSEEPDALALLARLEAMPGATVLRRPGSFNFSALVNAGVEAAAGPVVVLLNNDCEMVAGDAIARLARLAVSPGIGAVGAKLLYADGTIQHAGVAIGLGGEAGHRDRGRPADHPGSLGRLRVPHEVSAVTGACLAVRRDLFQDVGGFDESLPVAFNDIDFCLRLAARGHRTILDPGAVLIHAESTTRGRDDGPRRARFLAEAALFRERWRERILDDPFFPPILTTFRFRDLLG